MSLPTQKPHDYPCADLIRLQEKVADMRSDVNENSDDIRPLIELAAQIKLLMSLSIGGGALALFNLLLFLIERLN